MTTIVIPVLIFSAVVVALAGIVLMARELLSPSGFVRVTINGQRQIDAELGRMLLNVLADNGIYLPSGCGGRGTCGQCIVSLQNGLRPLLATEAAHIGRRGALAGQRLACMFRIRAPLEISVPSEALEVRRLFCTVASNRNVATFLTELILELPPRESFEFEAGDYVMLEVPPYRLAFRDLDIEPRFRDDWQRLNLLALKSELAAPTSRVYSLANPPQEKHKLMLVVRIATPPPGAPLGTPPGIASSYIFGLKPGDTVTISGPYGSFHAADSDKEMVLIGGGAGIAPLRSIILDQLERGTRRKLSFWYGSRDLRDLCYREEFEAAAAAHDNFEYHIALSQPRRDEDWDGLTGFIHAVVYEQLLKAHPAPDEAEYYLCGPPLMSAAVIQMLEELGVDDASIFFDDFGA